MYKVVKSFICKGCMNPVTGTRCTSVDSANLELVDKFCYLGDMMSVDRDADAAVDGINSGSWYRCLPIRIYHCQ